MISHDTAHIYEKLSHIWRPKIHKKWNMISFTFPCASSGNNLPCSSPRQYRISPCTFSFVSIPFRLVKVAVWRAWQLGKTLCYGVVFHSLLLCTMSLGISIDFIHEEACFNHEISLKYLSGFKISNVHLMYRQILSFSFSWVNPEIKWVKTIKTVL